jgi:hypothetical protein
MKPVEDLGQQENIELVRDAQAALFGGDAEAALASAHPDIDRKKEH